MSNQIIQIKDGSDNILPVNNESGSNANGNYTKFPDGLMIQWGVKPLASWADSVYFPTSFAANKDISVSLMPQYSDPQPYCNYNNIAVNKVDVITQNFPSGGFALRWIAIGYWK